MFVFKVFPDLLIVFSVLIRNFLDHLMLGLLDNFWYFFFIFLPHKIHFFIFLPFKNEL